MCYQNGLNDGRMCAGVGGAFNTQDNYDRGILQEGNERTDCNCLYDGPGRNSQLEPQCYVMTGQDRHYSENVPYSLDRGPSELDATHATPSNIAAIPQHIHTPSLVNGRVYQQGGSDATGLMTSITTSFPPSLYHADPRQCLSLDGRVGFDSARSERIVASDQQNVPFMPNGQINPSYVRMPVVDDGSSIASTNNFTPTGTPVSVDYAMQEHREEFTQEDVTNLGSTSGPRRASAKESEGKYRGNLASGYTCLAQAVNGTAKVFKPAGAVALKSRPKLLHVASHQIVDLTARVRTQGEKILELERLIAEYKQRLSSP